MTTTILSLLIMASIGGPMNQNPFRLETKDGRITTLRFDDDKVPTNYIAPEASLGDVHVTYRKKGGSWQTRSTKGSAIQDREGEDLQTKSWFEQKGERLLWRFSISNQSREPIEVGGLATPLPMHTRFDQGAGSSVMKHSFVSGSGSFGFWMRSDSSGPYLTMTCLEGTSLEYWNHGPDRQFQVFVHSASEEPTIREHKGSWRLPHTSKTLSPGASVQYGYAFEWAKDYDGVRDVLAKNGKLDVQVVPGMTVPTDLFAEVAIRSDGKIERLEAEYPDQTKISHARENGAYSIYRIAFGRLGENLITVHQGHGAKTYLEFFACEPVETLIKKRAAFLAKCQHEDPSKWYRGLISEWNMESQTLLGPDNYDRIKGWRIYEVSCDDPGLGKPAFLAAKNAEYPVQAEVTALDEYIEYFVWGGLQQTTQEPYPYGIYGIPDWHVLRNSKETDPTKGIAHLWRCYDYPHVVLLYHSMYRIATLNPGIGTRLTARQYLERAYGTALAMFTVPDKLVGWSAYETGFYNEVVIPSVIGDLEQSGMVVEAKALRAHWEKKVRTFVEGSVDLFGSEYPFDSTGFESTQTLADYAAKQGNAKAKAFMEKQMAANVFCRGSIEPAYYTLGSDYRGSAGDAYTLSYMSQMGGGSVLDYALSYAKDPAPYLRLGYQSILSAWALMNTGYWFPGKANDGGAGGGFEPAAYGHTWLDQPHGRGSWYYGCEIDLGYCGALRAARTVVADDPIFGRFCFGGTGRQEASIFRFIPLDGVRRRLSIRTKHQSLDLNLDGARFSSKSEIILDELNGTLTAVIEPTASPTATIHATGGNLTLDGKALAANSAIGASRNARSLTIRQRD